MPPQKYLSNIIDFLVLDYIYSDNSDNTDEINYNIIKDYRSLDKKCDNIISKIKDRKIKSIRPGE